MADGKKGTPGLMAICYRDFMGVIAIGFGFLMFLSICRNINMMADCGAGASLFQAMSPAIYGAACLIALFLHEDAARSSAEDSSRGRRENDGQ